MGNYKKFIKLILLFLFIASCERKPTETNTESETSIYSGPIIDMHIHAHMINDLPPEPIGLCIPLSTIVPHYDPKDDFNEVWAKKFSNPDCDNPIWSPGTEDEYFKRIKNQLDLYNITAAVTSGTPNVALVWKDKFPNRIIPSVQFRLGRDNIDLDSLEALVKTYKFKVLGEISNQYSGIAPNDPRMHPYYNLAQELDIPIAIHLGSGLPAHPYFMESEYKAALSNPLLLEELLKKYPKLRVSVMHYGDPFIDEMITMMYHYPQLYIDLGGIEWAYPAEYFYEYHLKKLVSAGFGKRVMFGSDMIFWPELISKSVDLINGADFLSYEQKADIFYNNAARFLRLKEPDNN